MVIPVLLGDELTLISCSTFNVIYSVGCHKVYLVCKGWFCEGAATYSK